MLAVAIQTNGQIIVGGGGCSGRFVLVRFNADGSLDTAHFGSGGIEVGADINAAFSMTMTATGETVLIGRSPTDSDSIILQEFNTLAATQILYVECDADYNVTSLTDTSGNVLERYEYDPYGNVTVLNADGTVRGDGTAASSFYGWVYLHQGLRLSVGTGMYYDRARIYDPSLGRFLQEDPAGYVRGTNRYQLETSNPTVEVDPSGFGGFDPIGGLSNIAGGIVRTGIGAVGSVVNAPIQVAGQATKIVGGAAGQVVGLVNKDAGNAVTNIGNGAGNVVQASGNGIKTVIDTTGNIAGNTVCESGQTIDAITGLAVADLSYFNGDDDRSFENGNWNLIGQIWGLPNTAIGLAWGLSGIPFGAQVQYGHNAIEFTNHPFMAGGITLGNTSTYGGLLDDGTVFGPETEIFQEGVWMPVAQHEMQHTFQSEFFGPLYLPLNVIGGISGYCQNRNAADPWHNSANFMEVGPLSYPPVPFPGLQHLAPPIQ